MRGIDVNVQVAGGGRRSTQEVCAALGIWQPIALLREVLSSVDCSMLDPRCPREIIVYGCPAPTPSSHMRYTLVHNVQRRLSPSMSRTTRVLYRYPWGISSVLLRELFS